MSEDGVEQTKQLIEPPEVHYSLHPRRAKIVFIVGLVALVLSGIGMIYWFMNR